jgi:hypothetical protein
MSAFNYVTFEGTCPSCGHRAVMRVQTHIASDYEGDERGRFMDRDYGVGERMWWFGPSHPDFDTWKTWGGDGSRVTEECYGVCTRCNAPVSTVVEFEDVTVKSIASVSPRP